MTTVFETEVCSRCGGTGHHSWNGDHDICYKCTGHKLALTKRGKAAKEYYHSKFQVPASEIKVGDAIAALGVRKLAVLEITSRAQRYKSHKTGGEWAELEMLEFRGAKAAISVAAAQLVRRLPTAAENEVAIADALAYQATLTKAGLPRKRG